MEKLREILGVIDPPGWLKEAVEFLPSRSAVKYTASFGEPDYLAYVICGKFNDQGFLDQVTQVAHATRPWGSIIAMVPVGELVRASEAYLRGARSVVKLPGNPKQAADMLLQLEEYWLRMHVASPLHMR